MRLFTIMLGLWVAAAGAALSQEVQLRPLFSGVEAPTSFADDGSGRFFITEQAGVVRVAPQERLRREPYLDLRAKVQSGGERGLLCIVFHPRFAENGRFFVNYTTAENGPLETVVSEFKAPPQALSADSGGERVLLRFRQPYANHNGGQLAFGPDGMLYIATGDGGSGGDPHNNAQDLSTLLGKILRIDVDAPAAGGLPYAIPKDNPFVQTPSARPEIWAYGLRNPWRFSFDRQTGRLWAADVGQNKWEEIDVIEKGGNYGWSAREGAHDFKPERAAGPLIDPVKEYGRKEGQCVTGGYVYRGKEIPALEGIYLYADFLSGNLWGLKLGAKGEPPAFDALLRKLPFNASAFGQDREGELYLLDYSGGRVVRLTR